MKLLFLLIFFLSLFASCANNQKYELVKTKISKQEYVLDTTHIMIKVSDKQLKSYKIFSVNHEGFYCGYNKKNNCLDLFSIKNSKFIKSIPIKAQEDISSISMVDNNKFYILSMKSIFSIDTTGKTSNRIFINGRKGFFRDNFFREIDNGRNFTFNRKDGLLYITTYNPKIRSNSVSQYKLPFIAVVNPNFPKSMRQLPIYYSNLYSENNYGFMANPQYQLAHTGNTILYNFPIEPNLYRYNIQSAKVDIFGGSPVNKEIKSPIVATSLKDEDSANPDKEFMQMVTNVYYFPVLSTQSTGLIFRAFHTPKTYNGPNQYNDINKNARYLSVFDKDLGLIETISLNDQMHFLFGQFVINEDYFLPSYVKPDMLCFKRFRFTLKNEL